MGIESRLSSLIFSTLTSYLQLLSFWFYLFLFQFLSKRENLRGMIENLKHRFWSLVALITFATYVLIDENNVLDSQKAFVALSLFNIMQFPMAILPMFLVFLAQAIVSCKRINKYMNLDEILPKNATIEVNKNAIEITKGQKIQNEFVVSSIFQKTNKSLISALASKEWSRIFF